MHGDIGALVDQGFYRPHGEDLASYFSGRRAVDRRATHGVFRDAPLVWIDVARGAAPSRERNDAEVEAVVRVLRRYAAAGVEGQAVAVICPYRKQLKAMERRLSREPELLRVAQVRTIDQVQGREYETVVLTLVRTDGSPGFMASPNRINVALSRAQRQLIVVGNAASFLQSRRVKKRARHLGYVIRQLKQHEQEV